MFSIATKASIQQLTFQWIDLLGSCPTTCPFERGWRVGGKSSPLPTHLPTDS